MSFELFPLEEFEKKPEQQSVIEIEDPYKDMCDYFDNIMKNAIVVDVVTASNIAQQIKSQNKTDPSV